MNSRYAKRSTKKVPQELRRSIKIYNTKKQLIGKISQFKKNTWSSLLKVSKMFNKNLLYLSI